MFECVESFWNVNVEAVGGKSLCFFWLEIWIYPLTFCIQRHRQNCMSSISTQSTYIFTNRHSIIPNPHKDINHHKSTQPSYKSLYSLLPWFPRRRLRISRPVWPAGSLLTLWQRPFDVATLRQKLIGTFAVELKRRLGDIDQGITEFGNGLHLGISWNFPRWCLSINCSPWLESCRCSRPWSSKSRRFFAGGFAVFRERVHELEVLMGTKVPSVVTNMTCFIRCSFGCFLKYRVVENLIKMDDLDDLGVPPFQKTPICSIKWSNAHFLILLVAIKTLDKTSDTSSAGLVSSTRGRWVWRCLPRHSGPLCSETVLVVSCGKAVAVVGIC